MTRTGGMDHDVRAVADAVLYEGYLLYPYRAGSAKNQSRWQFGGVLGPPGAAEVGVGEEPSMSAQCLLGEFERNGVEVSATVRFLHHQSRTVERLGAGGAWIPVDRLVVGERESISWDEATESEIVLGPWGLDELEAGVEETFCAAGVVEGETLSDSRGRVVGRIVRTRLPVNGLLAVSASAGGRTHGDFRGDHERHERLRTGQGHGHRAIDAGGDSRHCELHRLEVPVVVRRSRSLGAVAAKSLLSGACGGPRTPPLTLAHLPPFWCHRSSCTTFPRLRRRARDLSSTRPRSTKFSP